METRVSARRLAVLLGPHSTGVPAYRWLADGIRRLVADGRLLHGTRLPSERELLTQLGVSRTTVTRAYGVLRDRGYASAVRGSGTVVQVPGGPVAGGGEPLELSSLQPTGRDVVDLTCAAPAATPGLNRAYEAAVERMPSFIAGAGYFPLGVPELREAIAQRYADRGVPTDPDQIIVTTGALAALAATFRAVLRRADPVVVESPTYPNSLRALEHAGARVVGAPLVTEAADDVAGVIRQSGVRMMLAMPDFHNPTGVVWSDDERARIARKWRGSGVTGVVDETMSDTWLDGPVDARPMAAHAPGCVTVGSAAKTFWGGLRIGWIRAPHALTGAIARARLTMDLGAPVLEQLVVAHLLRTQGALSEESRQRIKDSRRVLLGLADRCPGWQVDVPTGGLSLWWHLPSESSTALVTAAERHGVLLAPGSLFAVDGRGLERWIRTPYALDAVSLRRAVDGIADAWSEVSSTRKAVGSI
ncbi:GntR family transcriptional regulator [Flexivirga endophytica]|uniref:GntR family transcriptional regulator n=1 Tax=Flexivirga endophytica TaxID=1849103 RepID=A0A916WQM0_9MICO|nr:PLP-dependent aminotransferase family protein [Flexivirga endophytica]GGB21261.1 GntR family transcriptional regulator [Flexivirga endophytica]GHB58948.1 GntR family transcriptional regulator [Flexivirga endophytica]